MTLPYVDVPTVGGIQVFGVSVFAAIGGGLVVALYQARRAKLPENVFMGMIAALTVGALFGAHVFDVAWYRWAEAAEDPRIWVRVHDGISLFGALLVIVGGMLVWSRVLGLAPAPTADATALAVLVAITIGRIGCALVHDHPGVPTSSPLGIDFPPWRTQHLGFPDGARLHDVGLEELLAMIPLTAAAWALARRGLRAGLLASLAAMTYASVRFALDFLRIEPVRAGLTGGQWGSLVLFVIGLAGFALVLRRRDA